jgi:hypothetical protein
MGVSTEFYQIFKYQHSLNFSMKYKGKEHCSNSFYEASITLTQKPEKDTSKKENYRPIS